MLALCLGLLLAAFPASAQTAAPVELFSIDRAGLTSAELADVLESGQGRYVVVDDRLIDVPASMKAGTDVALTEPEGEALLAARFKSRIDRLRTAARQGRLTEQDRAEARALAVLRQASLAQDDRSFLDSLDSGGASAGAGLLPTPSAEHKDSPGAQGEAPSGGAPAAGESAASAAARLKSRIDRLRSAAREGRLSDQDRADARALVAQGAASLASNDRYFLQTLNPRGAADAPAPAVPSPSAQPAAAADPLSLQLRARLVLDDHGDPAQTEALDMAVRLMLQSPTARELAAEFVKLDRKVKVSFEPLDGSALDVVGGRKYVAGIGGLTTRDGDGAWVKINAGYLQLEPRDQFREVPGTLAHELLGHAFNGARAENAGVTPAMNVWRGDEETAGVTGWLVQAEINGKPPEDAYCLSYLSDPEQYHRALDLVTAYYAQSLSPDEVGRLDEVYAQRLARAEARIVAIKAELDDRTDWTAVLDHFEKIHGIAAWRLSLLRESLQNPRTADNRTELDRLLDIRRALTQDLADLKDPVKRSQNADVAKMMRDPFFVDADKRLAVLTGRLRALASTPKPAAAPAVPAVPPAPDPDSDSGITSKVTVTYSLTWDELRRMYEDDKRDHPDHWPAAVPKT